MPKPTNDAIVRRHAELRTMLIAKHSKIAAEKIATLKKPTVEQIAE
jgi:hypothetical protein